MTNRNVFQVGVPLLAVAALAWATLSVGRANMSGSSAIEQNIKEVSSKDKHYVAALGRTEPMGGLRNISAEISGTITEVAVTAGAQVHRGQLLFRIDDRVAIRRVAERRAELTTSLASFALKKAQAETTKATLDNAYARLDVADTVLSEAIRELEVSERLADRNAIAVREVERRKASMQQAKAERAAAAANVMGLTSTLAQLDSETGSDIILSRAAITEAEERLKTAESDLGAHSITAKEDGAIVSIAVREGETSVPSVAVLTMAAGKEKVMRIYVNEDDAHRVDVNQPGTASSRGKADLNFEIKFLSKEPEVRANRELSGRSDDRIDTRVVEFLYIIPNDAEIIFGQTFDIKLPIDLSSPVKSSLVKRTF